METITNGVENNNNKDDGCRKVIRVGWRSAFLLLANQALATLSFFGVGVNLVLFLTRVLRQDNATAANNVSTWTGTVYLCSLFGAFLSDSYLGRYLACAIFQIVLILGLVLLSISSWLMLLHPRGCGDGIVECEAVNSRRYGSFVFYLAIYLVALGYGGHQPTLATFGTDQFKDRDKKSKSAFFSYFYFALNVGSLFSNTILVYYEDKGEWTLGFWLATASAFLGLAVFLAGSRGYRYVQPSGNPITRVAQVFCASLRKWNAKGDTLYEVQGSQSAIKGSRKIMHTNEFRCLDRAATITEGDECGSAAANGWKLCSVTQVEEAKCIIRMLPIWLCTIIYSVIFTQMASLFVEQGAVMHSYIGEFHIPAASMSVFDICSVLLCTGIYEKVLVPAAKKLTGTKDGGLTELRRMGVGLIIGILAMVAAGLTEVERLRRTIPGEKVSQLSILWQIPQFVLVGASEVFMYVGQLDFFNGQAPHGIKSFGSSLCMASMSLGNFVSSLLVNIVMKITARNDEEPGWIPENLNRGHLDRFYFLIAVLAVLDFFIYIFCARWYKYSKVVGDNDDDNIDNIEDAQVKSNGTTSGRSGDYG